MTSSTMATTLDVSRRLGLYEQMQRIRQFERVCIRLLMSGQIRGSMHPCCGQEAVSVGVAGALRPSDLVFFTYRGHGHAIAKGMPVDAAMAEMAHRATGSNRGWGGSMLLADFGRGVMGGNSIVAGSVPIAVGRALAAQQLGTSDVVVSCFGDGATNQGAWHEALVLAAMWQAPVVFVCENNEYSEMTPITQTVRIEHLADRAAAYGFPSAVVDGSDPEAVLASASEAVERAREGGGPTLLEMTTFRLDGHYVGDGQHYIPAERRQAWERDDPVPAYRRRLAADGIEEASLLRVEVNVAREVEDAVSKAMSAPYPESSELGVLEP